MAREQKKINTAKPQEESLVHTEKEGQREFFDTEEKRQEQERNAGSSGYTTKYQITELAEAAGLLFHTRPVIVRAALKAAGKREYTEAEALEIVKKFKGKEIK